MAELPSYQELRIRFERTSDDAGAYRVFASGPAGAASGSFQVPLSDLEIENLVLKLGRRSGRRRIDASELDLVRGFGRGLFDAVFNGQVRDVYRSSLASARTEGCGMRISLALTDTPELMHLPWEYLYDDPAFLSISMWTPVVRYLDLPAGPRPLKVEPPLRILAMVSSPSDLEPLDVAQEREKLEASLAELVEQGAVEIHWLPQATLQSLQRELRRNEFHVFHYIGHGGFDRGSDDGVLAFEDGTGRRRLVSAEELGTMLADETTLRLAVLNACEGARSSVDDPFSGVATTLVRREIPAVVAMQLEITDRAAITFATELYAALADNYPIDSALAEARKAIFADENEVEWATPVLFMRVPDGRIFDVEAPARVHEPVPEPDQALLGRGESGPVVPESDPVPGPVIPEPDPVPGPVIPEPDPVPGPVIPEPDPVPGPVVPEPDPGGRVPQRVPRRLIALLAGCIAFLVVAIFYKWDNNRDDGRSFLNPQFGGISRHGAAFFMVLSPLAVVLLAIGALVLTRRPNRLQLAAGLLVGCGITAAAKYVGLIPRYVVNDQYKPARDSIAIFCLVAAAGIVLIAIGVKLAQQSDVSVKRRVGSSTESLLLGVAGSLMLVGCLVPFNGGGTDSQFQAKSILPDETSQLLDPLIVCLTLLALAFAVRYLPRPFAAGLVLALGVESVALWVRYAGVAIVQDSDHGSLGPGAVFGLAGAVLALGAGLLLARQREEPAIEAAPATV